MTGKTGDSLLEPGWIPDWWRGISSSPQSQDDSRLSPRPEQVSVSAEEENQSFPSAFEPNSYRYGGSRRSSQSINRQESLAQDEQRLRTSSRRAETISDGSNMMLTNLSSNADKSGVHEIDEEEPSPDRIMIERDRDRAVNRRLRGIHIFMISINGVLGVGLYVRGGMILRLGGPLAVLLSFALLGLLVWGVMQCIAEMLCIWPISGALSTYVSEFVDVELGIAVGVAYWFTYAMSFAALVAATAAEAEYFSVPKGIQGGVLFFLVPLFLLVLNAFGIETYGFFEVFSGALKIFFLFVIIVINIVINVGGGPAPSKGTSLYPDKALVYDHLGARNWAQAFFMSLSISAFAYVGVEITAASALEARVPPVRNPKNPSAIGKTVRFSVVYISFVAAVMYVIAGVLITLNIDWEDGKLPRVRGERNEEDNKRTESVFVLIAEQSGIRGLADTLNVILMFTALTCANTNLYVASRTLFSLTRPLDGGSGSPWYTRFLATLGKTNKRKVPMRALVASCVFSWVPFLYLSNANGPSTDIGTILDVLSQMGTIGVMVVWACECWAYIRFYHCIQNNKDALRDVPLVRRWTRGSNNLADDYPYRSHGQPFTAYISLISCLLLLIVANGSSLWNGFHIQYFLSAYLAPICFLALWATLKILRKGQWRLVDLSNGQDLADKMLRLHEIRFRSAEEVDRGRKGIQNLWGLI